MNKVYFREEQRFNQWWIWLILLLISGVWIWQLVQQVFMGIPFGNNPAPDLVVILIGLFPVLGIWLFRVFTLETIIDEAGIHYRFRPFQKKSRHITPAELKSFEVKKYNPIMDYGGWGIRFGTTRKGNAYNVSGNRGALFEFKNGKKFMLGTQNPESMRSALNKLMKPPDSGSL
jgi:hypothetical protein